ncbi:MAG TPA: hypothetical protein VHL53_19475 [Acidimicrobiia bacterium]|nr:hypothetical protein [Acidimicrobiia bacterium]
MPVLLALWSPKGGSGTSVVAAAVALIAAGRGPARLADLGGDQPAILGLSLPPPVDGPAGIASCPATGLAGWLAAGPAAPTEWLEAIAVPARPGLTVLPRGEGGLDGAGAEAGAALGVALRDPGLTVVDAGTASAPAIQAAIDVADAALVVLRPCYLALRRAVAEPRLRRAAGVVLLEEPGRALDAEDVGAVLGLPVVGRVPVRAEIARAVDAGILRDRSPSPLATAAAAVLAGLDDLTGGRWAA